MSQSNFEADLDPVAISALRAARDAQRQMRNMGILETPTFVPEALPPVSTTPTIAQAVINYENFIEVENLPSKGLFYKYRLHAQALKLEDIIQIQTMDDINFVDKFSEIFSRRVRGVTDGEITHIDELYLALWLRATSFPDTDHPSSGFVCVNPDCKFTMKDPDYKVKFQQITFDADKLPTDILGAYKENGYVNEVLKSTGRHIQIHLRRRYHDKLVSDYTKANFYNNEIEPREEDITMLRIASIVGIQGVDDLGERLNVIKNFTGPETLNLIKLINKYSITIDPVVNHICPLCGEVTSLKGYPFRPDEYIPDDI